MSIELSDLFRIIMYVVLIIGVPVLLVQLYLLLKKTNLILEDVKTISTKAAEIAEDEETVRKFTQEVMSYTANDVIETQTHNISRQIANGLVKLISK